MIEIKVVAGIEYGEHERCRIDLFSPENADDKPLVACVHGGAWAGGGDRLSYHSTCLKLAEAGYNAVSIGYRVVPDAYWPEMAHDVLRGLSFLRERGNEYGVDASRVFMWGSSAGGHISLCLKAKADDWREAAGGGNIPEIAAVFAQCPVCVVPAPYNPGRPHQELTESIPCGEKSPVHMPLEKFDHVFIAHGRNDDTISFEHSVSFTEKVNAGGGSCELMLFDDAEHGFAYNLTHPASRKNLARALELMTKWR